MRDRMRFAPALLLGFGCLLLLSIQAQRSLALQAPLTALPDPLPGYEHRDFPVPDDQVQVAGMTNYVNRVFLQDSAEVFGLYVGFYDSQQQGKTVHSPKNCLPGSRMGGDVGGRRRSATGEAAGGGQPLPHRQRRASRRWSTTGTRGAAAWWPASTR